MRSTTGRRSIGGWIMIPAIAGAMSAVSAGAADWKACLDERLPLMGHRNWIAVVDSAYPLQVSAGVETIYADAGQLAVVGEVLARVAAAPHVRPVIRIDAELAHVAEADAPGIEAYRDSLMELLDGRGAQAVSHEDIIAKLDEAGRTFRVLVIKTNLTLPYTSVFIELDCGYWSAEAEGRLRQAMDKAKVPTGKNVKK